MSGMRQVVVGSHLDPPVRLSEIVGHFHLGHRPDRHDPFKNSDVHAGLRFGWLRAFVLQQKTKRTVEFEITAPTREAIAS